jgi:hypothetical protein
LNTRKYLRQKQVGKYILAYLVFIILNYVICLAPIGASYYFSPPTLLLSSFLAYCFTLLAVTVYSFIYFPKERVGGTITANLGITIAILFMVAYIAMFILYNLVDNVSEALNASVIRTVLLSFIPAFVIPLVLSVPVITLQVSADKSQQLMSTIKKLENEGDAFINKINKEGIS